MPSFLTFACYGLFCLNNLKREMSRSLTVFHDNFTANQITGSDDYEKVLCGKYLGSPTTLSNNITKSHCRLPVFVYFHG